MELSKRHLLCIRNVKEPQRKNINLGAKPSDCEVKQFEDSIDPTVVLKCSYSALPSLNQSNEFTGCQQLDMICGSTKGPGELDLVLFTSKLIKRKPYNQMQ